MIIGISTRPVRTNTKKKKKCSFHHMGPECKSRKSRDTWKTGKEYKINQGKGFGVQNEAGQRLTGFVKKTRLS